MQRSVDRRMLLAMMMAGVLGFAIAGRTAPAAAQAPPLSSDDLLQLVLPAGPDGERLGVIAWARYDAITPAGAPEIVVALLYETPAPFGTTDLRRLVNRVIWNGRAYEAAAKNDPGDVLSGELRRLGQPSWSVSIDLARQATDAGLEYVATYAGSGPLDNGGPGMLTLTELLGPDGSSLWRRITNLSERTAAGTEPTRSVSVTYRIEHAGNGPVRLLAAVSEVSTITPPTAGATPVMQLERFEENYVLDGGRFRLVTRSIVLQP
jgi:hypothetical protein